MSLLLIRHTAVAVADGICYGAADVPLAAGLEERVPVIKAALPSRPWTVYSSPSRRCTDLASLLHPDFRTDRRLRELDFGRWELRAWQDIPREELDFWCDDFEYRRPPGGENFVALAGRAVECICDCQQQHPDTALLFVTHAGVIRALLAIEQGIPLRDAFDIKVEFGGVYPLNHAALSARRYRCP